jgi:hypothetical protein
MGGTAEILRSASSFIITCSIRLSRSFQREDPTGAGVATAVGRACGGATDAVESSGVRVAVVAIFGVAHAGASLGDSR